MSKNTPITLVDTHCHINMMVKEKFDAPLTQENFELASQIAQDAAQQGVKYILNVGTSITECINCIDLAKKNTGMFAAVGIHPCDITPNWQQDLQKVKEFLKNKTLNKIVCIGECGLDLYHRQDTLPEQIDLLKAQIELALEQNLPLSIHMRQATEEMHKILDQYKHDKLTGVMHCFPESKEFADYVISLGLLIGIGGPVTYPKNTQLQETVAQIPLEKIILETDAPFLPPQIIRGKQNHPKYILAIAEHIAKLKNVTIETVAEQTTKNALNLFGFYKFE